MSLEDLCSRHAFQYEAQSVGRDTDGAPTREPFIAKKGFLGDLQPAGSNVQMRYARHQLVVTHQIYTVTLLDLVSGDRVTLDDARLGRERTFVVHGCVNEIERDLFTVLDVEEIPL